MSGGVGPEQEVSHPSPGRRRVSGVRLLLALILAPLAWLAQLQASYFFSSEACFPADYQRSWSVPGLWLLLLLVNFGCMAVGAVGASLAYSAWRRTHAEKKGDRHALLEVGEGRTRFAALSALIVSFIFFVAIFAEAAALFILGNCAPGTWF